MKLLIGFTAILSCYLTLGITLSCTHKAPQAAVAKAKNQPKDVSARQAGENKEPMIVQQFAACKAHR